MRRKGKSFHLHKRSGIYYVQFISADGRRLSAKSTGETDRDNAAAIAGHWLRNGIPSGSQNAPRQATTLFTLSRITETLKEIELTSEDALSIMSIIKTLTDRGLVCVQAVESSKVISALDYIQNFWDFDRSEYVRDKLLHGHSLTRRHCRESKRTISRYWVHIQVKADSCSGNKRTVR